MGSSCLNAEVNALERFQMIPGGSPSSSVTMIVELSAPSTRRGGVSSRGEHLAVLPATLPPCWHERRSCCRWLSTCPWVDHRARHCSQD
jgi:hypothetical protein